MAWTSTDEKNEFIRSTNYLESKFDSALTLLNEITKHHVNFENIGSIYKNKILDLSEMLQKQNVDFFSKNFSLSSTIINHLISILEEGQSLLQKIQKRLSILHPLYLNNVTAKMNDAVLRSLVERYQKLSLYIKNYQLDKDLEQSLLREYSRTQYWIYTPGSFYKQWEMDQYWLTRLQLDEVRKHIEPQLLPLIKKQEIASTKFQKKNPTKTIESLDIELMRKLDEETKLDDSFEVDSKKFT